MRLVLLGRWPLLLLSVVLVPVLQGCARDEGRPRTDADTARRADSALPVAVGATGAATVPGVKPECPATGLWSSCAVVQRLERSGLAPRVDSTRAEEPPLSGRGQVIKLGRGELELYLYENAPAREQAQAALDRTKYLDYQKPVGIDQLATLITSANAIVIMHSRNDHQRERVGDAITAGPPNRQP